VLNPEVLESKVKLFKKSFGVPSLVAGVATGGKEFYHAEGNAAPFKKADKDTVYRLASMSKSFITASVMMLAERGQLSIDSPVVQYMPDFKLKDEERTKKIAIRDIMSHRSGLPRHDITLFLRESLSLEQMAGIAAGLEPAWGLGERFHYQNHMFGVLSVLVQRVSGMPWQEFVERNIFKPLGMTRSYTRFNEYVKVDGNYARPMMSLFGLNVPAKSEDVTNCGASGSISASAADVIKWLKAHLKNGDGLFSESSAKEIHGPQTPIRPKEFTPYDLPGVEDRYYGFGWFNELYKGVRIVHHGGAVGGFRPFMAFADGQDLGVAVLVNQGGTSAGVALVYALLDEILGLEKTDWIGFYKSLTKEFQAKAKERAKEIVGAGKLASVPSGCFGEYEDFAYGKLEIKGTPQSPLLVFSDKYKMKLLPGAKDTYSAKVPGFAFSCRFRLENGKVAAFEANLEEEAPHYVSFVKKS
jgi:CubicO group peptidase (beta-lactamase class C family)